MKHNAFEKRQSVGIPARRAYVLNFHGIGEHHRTLEPGEENYWLSVAAFERYLDLIAEVNAGHLADVRITFDDGNLSDYEIAFPRLISRGLKAQFFVLTGRLNYPYSLSTEHLATLKSAGMRIGVHGVDHLDWKLTPNNLLERDIRDCKSLLEDALDAPVENAGVPYNSYDRRVLRTLKRLNLRRVYTSDGGSYRSKAWLRPRTCIRSDMPFRDVELMLTVGQDSVRAMRQKLGMLRKKYSVPDWTTRVINTRHDGSY